MSQWDIVNFLNGHKGRPGAEGPGAGQFGIANGLTCALAEEKTRESIFRALKSRRCYGTSGARILLSLAYQMRERGAALGLATLSISGGQGLAVVLERTSSR